MVTPRLHRYTYADYVGLEMMSEAKHEFYDGEIYAMAGGGEDHSAMAARMSAALVSAVGDGPCRAHSSDLRIYVEAVGLATFPDASVLCDPLIQHPPSPRATATNPTVIVEITSPSSEEYDNVFKLDAYKTIPTLREYVVVSHRERRITVHRRGTDGTWTMRVAVAGGEFALSSLDARIPVDEIYRQSTIK
jgi:Uma2 family endonuclease